MKKYHLIGISLLGMCLTACSSLSLNNDKDMYDGQDVAVLTDYELNQGFITITAVGHGCTFFDSFKVEGDKNTNSIRVLRTRPDECRMQPRNVSLQYSFKHLGLDLEKDVQVDNPLLSDDERVN